MVHQKKTSSMFHYNIGKVCIKGKKEFSVGWCLQSFDPALNSLVPPLFGATSLSILKYTRLELPFLFQKGELSLCFFTSVVCLLIAVTKIILNIIPTTPSICNIKPKKVRIWYVHFVLWLPSLRRYEILTSPYPIMFQRKFW